MSRLALLPVLVGLAFSPAAHAVSWTVGADLLHEALGAPGYGGGALFGPPLHPGVQAEGDVGYVNTRIFRAEQVLRVGGWNHAQVEGLFFITTAPEATFFLPAHLSISLEPIEVGVGFASLPGERYAVGSDGLAPTSDPAVAHLLLFAGLGLSWQIPNSIVAFHLSYRAGVERSPPPLLNVSYLPHSTLALGVSVDIPKRGTP